MTGRRGFLQFSIAAALAAGAAVPAVASDLRPTAVRTVLVDGQFPQARAVGATLGARGATVHTLTDADVTALWQNTLDPSWRQKPTALAGLTRAPALFVLEQLAWSHGMRVVYHAEHLVADNGDTAHQLLHCVGTGETLSTRTLEFLGPLWPGRVASVIASWGERPMAGRAGPSCAGLAPVLPPGTDLLTSWIIAPV